MPDKPMPSPSPETESRPAEPIKMPEPTLWPPALALGATFMVWGLISSRIITFIGLALFAISIAGWIREIRHERNS